MLSKRSTARTAQNHFFVESRISSHPWRSIGCFACITESPCLARRSRCDTIFRTDQLAWHPRIGSSTYRECQRRDRAGFFSSNYRTTACIEPTGGISVAFRRGHPKQSAFCRDAPPHGGKMPERFSARRANRRPSIVVPRVRRIRAFETKRASMPYGPCLPKRRCSSPAGPRSPAVGTLR